MDKLSLILPFVLSAIEAYILGSISFSIIITKVYTGNDVRKQGSGNAGATNVLRTAGKMPAIMTFAADFIKSIAAIAIAILLAYLFHLNPEYLQFLKCATGIFCMIGHIFPMFFRLKGGKGVTSAAAIVLMLDWRCFVIAISFFIIITIVTRFVSLGSILASSSVPFLILFFESMDKNRFAVPNALLVSVISIIVVVKHRVNIGRLLKGTESRIQSKK